MFEGLIAKLSDTSIFTGNSSNSSNNPCKPFAGGALLESTLFKSSSNNAVTVVTNPAVTSCYRNSSGSSNIQSDMQLVDNSADDMTVTSVTTVTAIKDKSPDDILHQMLTELNQQVPWPEDTTLPDHSHLDRLVLNGESQEIYMACGQYILDAVTAAGKEIQIPFPEEPVRPASRQQSQIVIPKQVTCYGCGGSDFWQSKQGKIICRKCHPPTINAEMVLK